MTHVMWLRYLDVGERLATDAPDFFPTVVSVLDALASDSAFRRVVHDAFGVAMPRPASAPCARTVGDMLCLADARLADVPHLDCELARLSAAERRAAEDWARARVAAAGDGQGTADDGQVVAPACVRRLFGLCGSTRRGRRGRERSSPGRVVPWRE